MPDRSELTPHEKAVSEIQPTEQDLDQMILGSGAETAGQPGTTDLRADVDHDDDQMTATTSHPLIGEKKARG